MAETTENRRPLAIYVLAGLAFVCATVAGCLKVLSPGDLKEIYGLVLLSLGWLHVPAPGERRAAPAPVVAAAVRESEGEGPAGGIALGEPPPGGAVKG